MQTAPPNVRHAKVGTRLTKKEPVVLMLTNVKIQGYAKMVPTVRIRRDHTSVIALEPQVNLLT